jgi:RNA-directed DNA polymerase
MDSPVPDGYRPNKSAIDAIKITRERCWKYDWLIEFDIKGLFDNIDHELLMKAVRKHTDSKWVILYIERWLKAPIQMPNGTTSQRFSGTPQGSAISPILANLFMHYAFDRWMETKNPHNPWARYADDGVIHCKTKEEAQHVLKKLTERMKECKLEIHPEKTAIIYCKDVNRKEEHDNTSFDFLGYTFRTRVSRNRNGQYFASFSPAVSKRARKAFRDNIRDIRKGSSHKSLEQMAKEMNPVLRGWANYFGCFRPSEMRNELIKVNLALVCWAIRKYKGLKRHKSEALHWLGRCAKTRPDLFYHWEMGLRPAA